MKNVFQCKLMNFFLPLQVHGSTGTSVLLDRVSLSAEGTFSCEVITLPNFITKTGSKYLEVARIPKQWERPEIHFRGGKNKLRYSPGDTIDVECISKGGYPPPNITWFINGEKVKRLRECQINLCALQLSCNSIVFSMVLGNSFL